MSAPTCGIFLFSAKGFYRLLRLERLHSNFRLQPSWLEDENYGRVSILSSPSAIIVRKHPRFIAAIFRPARPHRIDSRGSTRFLFFIYWAAPQLSVHTQVNPNNKEVATLSHADNVRRRGNGSKQSSFYCLSISAPGNKGGSQHVDIVSSLRSSSDI